MLLFEVIKKKGSESVSKTKLASLSVSKKGDLVTPADRQLSQPGTLMATTDDRCHGRCCLSWRISVSVTSCVDQQSQQLREEESTDNALHWWSDVQGVKQATSRSVFLIMTPGALD